MYPTSQQLEKNNHTDESYLKIVTTEKDPRCYLAVLLISLVS